MAMWRGKAREPKSELGSLPHLLQLLDVHFATKGRAHCGTWMELRRQLFQHGAALAPLRAIGPHSIKPLNRSQLRELCGLCWHWYELTRAELAKRGGAAIGTPSRTGFS
jgi:hypothetical protein